MYRTGVLAVGIVCLAIAGRFVFPVAAQGKYAKYMSERSAHQFLGTTRVSIEGFDASDKDAKSAMLQFDRNELSYSSFGDPQITVVFYEPFQVKLTRLDKADPESKGRHLFAVELPKEAAQSLGKDSMRLVTGVGAKSEITGVRLLLVDADGKVRQTVDLRAASN